jgi:hypothetical protein
LRVLELFLYAVDISTRHLSPNLSRKIKKEEGKKKIKTPIPFCSAVLKGGQAICLLGHSPVGNRRGGGAMTGTSMLYHYFRKFDGNVCMDWRLTNDLNTTLQTTKGKTELVNTKAFETFLNPDFKGSEPGSCQGAGHTYGVHSLILL